MRWEGVLCHRVNPLILKRAISHILPQLPFYLFFLRCPSSYFFSFLLFLSYQFMVMGSTPWQIRHNRNNEISLYSLFFSLFLFMGATKRLLEKTKIMGKIRWNNMKISGDMIGNDGNRMGIPRGLRSFFWVCYFHEVGLSRKKPGYSKVNIRIKKDLM